MSVASEGKGKLNLCVRVWSVHINFHIYMCIEMLIFLFFFIFEGKKANNCVTTPMPTLDFTWNTPLCRLLPESGMVK